MDLWLLAWPVRLVSDRSFDALRPAAWTDAGAWISLLVLLALLVLALAMRWRHPLVSGWLVFLDWRYCPRRTWLSRLRARWRSASSTFPRWHSPWQWRPGVALPESARGVGYAGGAGVALYRTHLGAQRGLARQPHAGLADVETAPRSARLHDMLAKRGSTGTRARTSTARSPNRRPRGNWCAPWIPANPRS